ncbi:MAG TPA: hypothetical protein VN577_01145 [Terriglobales bacterium]|nr:hypothetical protein [Terriglobales bacterium]
MLYRGLHEFVDRECITTPIENPTKRNEESGLKGIGRQRPKMRVTLILIVDGTFCSCEIVNLEVAVVAFDGSEWNIRQNSCSACDRGTAGAGVMASIVYELSAPLL